VQLLGLVSLTARRTASLRQPLLATRIEAATREVAERSDGLLGIVPRESLVRHPEIFSGLEHQSLGDRSEAHERI
jgi:hypothetical protein